MRFLNFLDRYRRSTSGSFATTFALSILATLICVGAAIDLNHATKVKKQLQAAIDTTVLAAVNDPSLDSPGLISTANEWFAANGGTSTLADSVRGWVWRAGDYPDLFDSGEDDPDAVKIMIWADMPTSFMGMFGKDTIPITVNATASGSASKQPFELVIAMDTTASMAAFGANWPRAVAAFTSMIETMDENAEDGLMEDSTVGFIPFSDRVNVGVHNATVWGKGPSGWNGCLHPRENTEGSLNFMLDDAPSLGGDKFFRRTSGTCPQELSTPTYRPSEIASAMSTITPRGTGRFDIGLAWAWRMVSPNWRGQWGLGSDYPKQYGEKKKIIVFFSDGYSIIYEYEVHTSGTPTRPWGWNKGTPEAFEHFEQLCTNMKAEGVELHMVYLNGNEQFKPYMERCATSEDYFHEVADISSLETALENVAEVSTGFRMIH